MPVDTKKTWNACGEAFDRFTTAEDSFSDNIERPALERLIGDLNLTGARALDLGCGSGTYSSWLAERGARVVGVDLSSTMVSLAKARAQERGMEIELCVADISKPLPFDKAQFDFVFTATALHYVKDIEAAIKEAERVMKPGARFVASVLHPLSTSRFPVERPGEPLALEAWDTRRGWQSQYFGSPTRAIETPWLGFGDVSNEGRRIVCHHHTTADYFSAFRSADLTITHLAEPQPPAEFAAKSPERYEEAMREPIYLMFRAEAPNS
jgi:SAM-dependent methyltransferase